MLLFTRKGFFRLFFQTNTSLSGKNTVPQKCIPHLKKFYPNCTLFEVLRTSLENWHLEVLADVHKHLLNSSCGIIIIDSYLEFSLSTKEDFFKIFSSFAFLKDTYKHSKVKFQNKDLILLCPVHVPNHQLLILIH